MELSLLNTIQYCRGCLAESGDMKNMFDCEFADDFCKFTNIEVRQTDNISELLCSLCEEALLQCRNFRTQCQKSDWFLRNSVKRKTTMVKVPTEDDDNVKEENSPQRLENDIFCLFYDKKLEIIITAPNMQSKIILTCPYQCSVTFHKKSDLLYHLAKKHEIGSDFSIDLKYYCTADMCQYNFNSKNNKYFSSRKFLNQHYNKVHKSKTFCCDICKFSFSTDSAYRRHLKTCNFTYECRICNIVYKTNENLLVHLMRKHPLLHKQYKIERKAEKRKSKLDTEAKKAKADSEGLIEYMCDSPKRSFATQTLQLEENIKNDVSLPSWSEKSDSYETKKDEISTQTVFEDLLSLKSQTSEDESIYFSESVSLSDIQTQTFPLEFGLSRSNKETITSETQSPDISIKETQTCVCLYDSPKFNFKLFDGVSSNSVPMNLTSTETQTADFGSYIDMDILMGLNSAETQTSFEESYAKDL